MSKKDYILLSKVVNAELNTWQKDSTGYKAVSSVAYTLAQTLKLQNARFDSEKFLTACGIMK